VHARKVDREQQRNARVVARSDDEHAAATPAAKALRLQATAGNAAVAATIQRRGEGGTAPAPTDAGTTAPPDVDKIVQRYRDMIAAARKDGKDHAADNLERWLNGVGGTKTEDVPWLRGFSEITDAEKVNQGRFEKSLTEKGKALKDGESVTFTDHWDRKLTASVLNELYYASGTSTITSTGTFTLSRSGDTVTITGTVGQHWHDPYDWHAGLGAFIPGFGGVSDSDALLVERERGAKPFMMESDWQQNVSGTISLHTYWFDSSTYTWSGP
jgi:hypothetical protein